MIDFDRAWRPDGHMTKRRNMDGPHDDPPKRGGPGAVSLILALLLGVMFALNLSTTGDPGSTFSQVPNFFADLVQQPRQNIIRLGDWPIWLFNRDQETRRKSLPSLEGGPAIAIVVDDLGADAARTREAIALPANVTMSFLPYPDASQALSHRAHLAGHEIIVHLPMQPIGNENPGAKALMSGLAPAELQLRTSWALSRVSDYDGANNHMGSRFTASRADLLPVMRELRVQGLFFLDSRTTEKTKAEAVAQELGMLTGARDIFLDDDQSAAAVKHQLASVEQYARKNGTVIAIGHPYPETLKSLEAWTKTLKSRGYQLLPLADVLKLRDAQRKVSALSPPRGD
jgi:polysaccharide deacetylase 2 family uncharacterized protein YibQ